jgi:hypothetical protein
MLFNLPVLELQQPVGHISWLAQLETLLPIEVIQMQPYFNCLFDKSVHIALYFG